MSAGQALNDPIRLPRAVLWDMDGTLVETEPYWIECEYEMAVRHGAAWSEQDAMALVGGDLIDSATYIKRRMGLDATPEAIVEDLLDGVVARVRDEVPWRPGARELLEVLAEHGIRSALVTMSWTRLATPIVEALPAGTFEVVVTGDRVARGKPHPDPYLLAAAELGLEPRECLAVEDSATGVASAVAAGCPTLVVPNHVQVPRGPGRHFRDTLVGLDADGLAGLAQVWQERSDSRS